MPVLSVFYGIIVYMFYDEGCHHLPHIHVEYADFTAVLDLKGKIIKGKLPANKKKILDAWIMIHREELDANWKLIKQGLPALKIDPLK